LALAVTVVLTVSGCGGGSSVRPVPPPPTSPPPAPSPAPSEEPQPAVDAHLKLVHADQAHDAGFTGKGVTIGVVDSGVNRNHPALKGRVLKEYINVDPALNNVNKDDVVGHGTMVALIAAGKPFDKWPGGIAPDADIVSDRIIADKEPSDDGSGHGNEVEVPDAAFFAQTLIPELMQSPEVQVMNNSWGGLYFGTSNTQNVADAFADAYKPFVIKHDGLVVFAAGNHDPHGYANPSDLASLPSFAPDLERGWLVAVALDTQKPTRLADYSNQCGRAKDYCLAAPGNVVVPGSYEDSDGWNLYVAEGTSFAAPEVSGAAALVWQAFPYFSNDMVRQTLLGTAKDLGDPGVDKVFGWGLLNVGKAVNGPGTFAWGDVSVSFDDTTSTWSNDIDGTGGLIKSGTGTLVLTGKDTYSGGTSVNGGVLQATHSLAGDVSIARGAMLDGIKGATGNLTNAGTVAVHDGATTIGGDYTQAASGTLAVSLGSKLDVAGTATLNGGTLAVTGADEGYVANTHTDVLTADGGVGGTFDKLDKAQGVVFTSTTINYGAKDVWLDTTGLDVTTAAAGGTVRYTPASMGSAKRVQGAFETLNTTIASGSLAGVSSDFLGNAGVFQRSPNLRAAQASLESLSGQLHAASAAMTLETIDVTGRALSGHLADLSSAGFDEAGIWMHDLSLSGAMARNGYANVDYQLNGWLVGNDVRLSRHALAGFAFSQGHGIEQLNGRFDRNRSLTTAGMVYAGFTRHAWYVEGRVGMGHYQQHMNRMLLLGTTYQGVWTDYAGHYNVAYGESGLHLELGSLRLTPFADLEYDRVARNGFAEQGAGGFGLKADRQLTQRWQGGVGMKLARQWRTAGGGTIGIDARAQWRQTLAASGAVFDASFVGLNQWQPLSGVGLSRHSAVFGLDFNAQPSARTQVKLGYEYLTGERGKASVASARFSLAF
jgi:autotransporter-associated beta strand protein